MGTSATVAGSYVFGTAALAALGAGALGLSALTALLLSRTELPAARPPSFPIVNQATAPQPGRLPPPQPGRPPSSGDLSGLALLDAEFPCHEVHVGVVAFLEGHDLAAVSYTHLIGSG